VALWGVCLLVRSLVSFCAPGAEAERLTWPPAQGDRGADQRLGQRA